MAEAVCDKPGCGRKFDPSWNGTKQCTKCKRWFCEKCGYQKTQCPVCKTCTLKH